ncbi:MAG: hypothetical protein AVDCRST_MAG73-856, partial [uncultured Thermomicrobiales bacterium]
ELRRVHHLGVQLWRQPALLRSRDLRSQRHNRRATGCGGRPLPVPDHGRRAEPTGPVLRKRWTAGDLDLRRVAGSL